MNLNQTTQQFEPDHTDQQHPKQRSAPAPADKAAAESSAPPFTGRLAAWTGAAASAPGRRHIREGIPCQDASAAGIEPRPYLVVADGRGSAEHSDIGAQAACETIPQTVKAAETLLSQVLDHEDEENARTLWPIATDLLFKSVQVRQAGIAGLRGLPSRQLEHTLLLAIIGTRRIATLHVGDGAIVEERGGVLGTLSAPQRGEFANITCFLGADTRADQVRTQLVPAEDVTALAAVSDGAADRMIHSQTNEPAKGFTQIFQQARDGRFRQRNILRFLTEEFWEPIVQDDRSLALLTTSQSQKRNPVQQKDSGTDALCLQNFVGFRVLTFHQPEVKLENRTKQRQPTKS